MTHAWQETEMVVEQRIAEYFEEELEKLGHKVPLEITRSVHPRSPAVVVFSFLVDGIRHRRYADFDAGSDKPLPHFTNEDPCPLHS